MQMATPNNNDLPGSPEKGDRKQYSVDMENFGVLNPANKGQHFQSS